MTKPPQAVGIDLGTTYSVIAFLDQRHQPRSLLNSEGDVLTPSAVLIEDDTIVVGKEAVKAVEAAPESVALSPKRDMGCASYHRAISGVQYPPEVLQSLILEKLKRDAERSIGPFSKAVITVPAFFNEPRRKATQDAGRLAGIEVLDIINEPTAAALAYGVQNSFIAEDGEAQAPELVMVYDLGGGTFDVTLVSIEGNNYRTLATAGDVYLGGLDWDKRLVEILCSRFREAFRGIDPASHLSTLQRVMREAEDIKRSLSAREQAVATVHHAGESLRVRVTRQEFEEATKDLLERTLFTTRQVLREAGITWKAVTRLLLVGGMSRMPAVAMRLQEESGLKPEHSLSADEAVAHGAALYAGLLLGSPDTQTKHDMKVRNVNAHSLGVKSRDPETGLNTNSIIIPKNTPLPASRMRRFRTSVDSLRSLKVTVLEGGDRSGNHSTTIGTLLIDNLPDRLPKGTMVNVEFTYESNGRIRVNAELPGFSHHVSHELKRDVGLTKAQRGDWSSSLKRYRRGN